ncbi:MAG: hypothetical protein Q9217_004143 [Psora testacea]
MAPTTLFSIVIAVLAISASFVAVVYEPITRRVRVLGISRPLDKIQNLHGEGLKIIPNTIACEDLHHHTPSGLLFGVAETDEQSRKNWFPPTDHFNEPEAIGQGIIFTLDPQTKETTQLTLIDFSGPFVTHGIDIYSPPSEQDTVFIVAVNHLPNPASATPNNLNIPKAGSQIEIFHHTLGTKEAKHLRSIIHPLIRTPNDIFISNPQSIYVTNDHHHREGLGRLCEDLGWQELAPWSDIIHISIQDLNTKDASSSINTTIALDRVHNPNGLGHGKTSDEILLGRASAGVMPIMKAGSDHKLEILESIQLQTTVDNPTYFHDPFAKDTGRDASGYVLAGLTRAVNFPAAPKHPTSVWLVGTESREHRLVFQDDGNVCNTASTAVLVAIDPMENRGRKQAWLFVTGPMGAGVASTMIDL